MIKPLLLLPFGSVLISMLASPLDGASEQIKKEDFITIDESAASSLISPLTYIYELKDLEELNGFSNENKPVYVKFKINENIEVLDAYNNNLGDFSLFYETYLEGKYLPCIEITNQNVAIKYEEYIEKYFVRDLAIYSNDIAIFSDYSNNTNLNKNYFVFDVSSYDLSKQETFDNLIQVSTIFDINIFSIDASYENLKGIVEDFKSYNKVVWSTNLEEDYDYYQAIASGANGLISPNFSKLIECSSKFDEAGLTSRQFISAHRGAVNSEVNENSLSSIKRAADLNADFVEIDLQITEDKEIMLCHNDALKYTTNCEDGSTFQRLTYEETQQYVLTDNGVEKNEKIPTLKEVFEANKDNDLKFILEFKFDQGFLTGAWDVAKYVDEIVRNYDMENRVLGITFFKIYFESMNEHMPYMPKMYLGLDTTDVEYKGVEDVTRLIKYFKKYTTGFDIGYKDSFSEYASDYISRGYNLNSWTFKDFTSFSKPLNFVTTDTTDEFVELVKEIHLPSKYMVFEKSSDISENIQLEVEKFNGEKETKDLKLKILEGDIDSAYLTCVAYYEDSLHNYELYSDIFTISNLEKGGLEEESKDYIKGSREFNITKDNYLDEIGELTYHHDNLGLIISLSIAIPLLCVFVGVLILILIRKKLTKIKK